MSSCFSKNGKEVKDDLNMKLVDSRQQTWTNSNSLDYKGSKGSEVLKEAEMTKTK